LAEPGRSNVIGIEHTTPMTHCQREDDFSCMHIFPRKQYERYEPGSAAFGAEK
jgi:hypothetical protein